MIIVISDTKLFAGEANIVNALCDKGLALFHLRKYENSNSELAQFIQEIKPEHRNKIVFHQFHEIAREFGLSRLHFSERDRNKASIEELEEFKNEGFVLSTSVHSINEYNTLSTCFDYAFLSPVFDSISKDDYKAVSFDLNERKTSAIKLIALGGVNEDNCVKAFDMGFDGVALLGSIWKSENKIERYNNIRKSVPQFATFSTEK